MAGDDVVLSVYQDRRAPAEFPNARRDLRHLRIGMLFGISGIGDQQINCSVIDVK